VPGLCTLGRVFGGGWAPGPWAGYSMDPSKDGGAFAAAPPPIGGLGNFKGVMLCNRPMDDPSSKLSGGAEEPAPFRSMISGTHGDPIGLTPVRTIEETVKTRGPSAALRRHVRWLKELQDQMKDERQQVEMEDKQDEERKRKMKETFEKHRDAVRDMMAERAKDWVDPFAPDPEKQKQLKASAMAKKQAKKPLWAMTQKEQDDFEEEAADDLINFAEGLDYDKYIGDLEFRQGLDALRDRAGKLTKEQEAFKDALLRDFNTKLEDEERSTSVGSPRLEDGVDGQSLLGDLVSDGTRRRGQEERSNADGRPDWDSSTAYGDEPRQLDEEIKDAAKRVMESNSQIRAVHSKESVARIIEKAKERQSEPAADLIEQMMRDGPAPAPVIVASSDTQHRLHKPVDPSLLPYLYRSPAV